MSVGKTLSGWPQPLCFRRVSDCTHKFWQNEAKITKWPLSRFEVCDSNDNNDDNNNNNNDDDNGGGGGGGDDDGGGGGGDDDDDDDDDDEEKQ